MKACGMFISEEALIRTYNGMQKYIQEDYM